MGGAGGPVSPPSSSPKPRRAEERALIRAPRHGGRHAACCVLWSRARSSSILSGEWAPKAVEVGSKPKEEGGVLRAGLERPMVTS
jgi:hypothetical protein